MTPALPGTADRTGRLADEEDEPDVLAERVDIHTVTCSDPPRAGAVPPSPDRRHGPSLWEPRARVP